MQDIKGLKVLVTGGAGFVGSHLVDALLREECRVRVFDKLSKNKLVKLDHLKDNAHFEFIKGDLLNQEDAAQACKEVDIVFHLAGLGVRHSLKYPMENYQMNAEGTMNILESARLAKVKKFIFCSSAEVYGTGKYVPMSEDHPIEPRTIYGSSKFSGELYTSAYHKSFGLNTVVVRPFNIYGPRSHFEKDSGELIPKIIVRVLNNENIFIFGDGSQTRDFTYVEDAVKGLVAVSKCTSLNGQVVNIGSGKEITILEIAKKILQFNEESHSVIEFADSRPGDILRYYSDTTKLNEYTGWTPEVSLEEGLKRTMEWFRAKAQNSNLMELETALNWK